MHNAHGKGHKSWNAEWQKITIMTKQELKWNKEDLKSHDFYEKNHEDDKEQLFDEWVDNFVLSDLSES